MADIATLEINTDPLIATLEIQAVLTDGSTNLGVTRTSTAVTVTSDTGTDAAISAADSSNAGVMTAADKSKLDGIASGATANSSDATLLARANHTGTQAISTITNLQSTLDGMALSDWVTSEFVSSTELRTPNTFLSGPSDASTASAEFRRIAPDDLSPDSYSTAASTNVLHGNMTWDKVALSDDVSGTLPVANGGTGATSVYAARRAMFLGMHRVITSGSAWYAGNISGTTTQGTESTNFYGFLNINTATAGKNRLYHNVSSSGPLWPGAQGVPDFSRKCIVNLSMLTRLSAHTDSRISVHFTLTSVSTHTSFDRSEEGISIILRGGSSAGTVAIQTHDGTTATTSATASIAINDQTGYPWTLEWEPGVAARLYRGSTLMCTATANLPSGTTAGVSQMGVCVLAENTTNGTGNATTFRWLDCYLTEIP